MIRAAIIYFSGTGNTKFVACNMKKKDSVKFRMKK